MAWWAPLSFALALVAWSAVPGHAVTYSIGENFTGTHVIDEPALNGGFAYFPPDTMGAVGPDHIAEILNGSFAVYDKTGNLQTRVSLNTFWNTALASAGTVATASDAFDPRILYDKGSGRWYAISADDSESASSRIHIGVTIGSDPSPANWRGFAIDADPGDTHWADFPTLGINAEGIYISNNMFRISDNFNNQVTLIGVPKASLTAAIPSISGFQVRESLEGFTEVAGQMDVLDIGFAFQPAVDMDNGNLPLPGLWANYHPLDNKVWRPQIPADFFSGGAIADKTNADFITSVQPVPPDAQQPAPGPDIATNDPRFSGNVVLQDGKLWAVQGIGSGGRAAIKWYEIDAATNNLDHSGLITDANLDFYFPSIAVNDFGKIVIGFTGSGELTPASSYVAVGELIFGIPTFDPVVQTHLGNGTYARIFDEENRWGDYSATVVDPTDENTFWTFQEFVDGNNRWSIRITEINFLSAPVPEPSSLILVTLGTLVLRMARKRRSVQHSMRR